MEYRVKKTRLVNNKARKIEKALQLAETLEDEERLYDIDKRIDDTCARLESVATIDNDREQLGPALVEVASLFPYCEIQTFTVDVSLTKSSDNPDERERIAHRFTSMLFWIMTAEHNELPRHPTEMIKTRAMSCNAANDDGCKELMSALVDFWDLLGDLCQRRTFHEPMRVMVFSENPDERKRIAHMVKYELLYWLERKWHGWNDNIVHNSELPTSENARRVLFELEVRISSKVPEICEVSISELEKFLQSAGIYDACEEHIRTLRCGKASSSTFDAIQKKINEAILPPPTRAFEMNHFRGALPGSPSSSA
ncbi:hypothetical protein CSUB01_03180 [Colletotrichum sublineola]|uniref:Uncharacterized protein n=1 Tax=Colletotrichum sublineola TaxID=1173701 RepID=A0A066WYV8_COLSU|nr:hypothetical protein CSUB01_03180 [Colletotrichum sublineola]